MRFNNGWGWDAPSTILMRIKKIKERTHQLYVPTHRSHLPPLFFSLLTPTYSTDVDEKTKRKNPPIVCTNSLLVTRTPAPSLIPTLITSARLLSRTAPTQTSNHFSLSSSLPPRQVPHCAVTSSAEIPTPSLSSARHQNTGLFQGSRIVSHRLFLVLFPLRLGWGLQRWWKSH